MRAAVGNQELRRILLAARALCSPSAVPVFVGDKDKGNIIMASRGFILDCYYRILETKVYLPFFKTKEMSQVLATVQRLNSLLNHTAELSTS